MGIQATIQCSISGETIIFDVEKGVCITPLNLKECLSCGLRDEKSQLLDKIDKTKKKKRKKS